MASAWELVGRSPCSPKLSYCYIEYINFKPRFHTRGQIAQALAAHLCGLSSWRVDLPHSTLLYYFRKLSRVRYVVPLSGTYAVDETKVLEVKGGYYYLWIVRDVNTRALPFFVVKSARSGVHVNNTRCNGRCGRTS